MTFQDINRRRYEGPAFLPGATTLPQDSDDLLELAKSLYDEESERGAQLDEKVRTLLNISGILIPLTVGLMTIIDPPLLASIPLAFLLITTVMILEFFGTDTLSFPSIDKELLESGSRQKELIVSYMKSTSFNQNVNNFRVDLYRVSRRLFLASLVLTAGVGVVGVRNYESVESRVANKLVTNPSFIKKVGSAVHTKQKVTPNSPVKVAPHPTSATKVP